RARDRGPLARPRAGLHRPGADRRDADARARRRPGPVGPSGRRHARRREVRGARVPTTGESVSYTLRGRLESRLAAPALPLLAACVLAGALREWWPVELAGLMLGVGLAFDVIAYDRLLDYQPGWFALPLGLLELGVTVGLAQALELGAPLAPALAFFAGSWLLAPALRPARFPPLPPSSPLHPPPP